MGYSKDIPRVSSIHHFFFINKLDIKIMNNERVTGTEFGNVILSCWLSHSYGYATMTNYPWVTCLTKGVSTSTIFVKLVTTRLRTPFTSFGIAWLLGMCGMPSKFLKLLMISLWLTCQISWNTTVGTTSFIQKGVNRGLCSIHFMVCLEKLNTRIF